METASASSTNSVCIQLQSEPSKESFPIVDARRKKCSDMETPRKDYLRHSCKRCDSEEEIRGNGLRFLVRSREVKYQEFSSKRENKTRKEIGNHTKSQQEKEVEATVEEEGVGHGFHQKVQENTAFLSLLKVCAKHKDLYKGSKIHAEILKRGLLENDVYIGSTLVHMYCKCGALAKAQEVFDNLPVQNVVSWNVLIAGYSQHGHAEEALNCLERMQHKGICPDSFTYVCILRACGTIGSAYKARQVHAEIIKEGLLEHNSFVGNSLVDMYAKCGEVAIAQEVFDELPFQDVVTWNALITGYAQHGRGNEALYCCQKMQCRGLLPDAITFVCILKACGNIGAVDNGKEIHARIIREGFLEKNLLVGTALIDMYARCSAVMKAQEVFDELPAKNVFTWTALIAGYVQHGNGEAALKCFQQMQHRGLSPTAATFVCALKACGSIGAANEGTEIHAEIVKEGFVEGNIFVGTALVDMYAKCGALVEAREVFDELPVSDVVSWNALIAGYAEHDYGEEALKCYEKMQCKGISPDPFTFVCILKACGSIGAADKGKEMHAEVIKEGLLEKDVLIGTALVDMYAKCGALSKAHELFDELPVHDVSSWTALITAYAQLGKDGIVFELFNEMVGEGIKPDLVTFTVVLSVCGHSGLLDKGQKYFEIMSRDYGLIPTLEHHACMVDLFGRAGHFDEALGVVQKMPLSVRLWHTLLGSCQKWGNVKLGRLAYEHAIQLDEQHTATYVCMINMYSAAGMQENADTIEALRVQNKAWKEQGCG